MLSLRRRRRPFQSWPSGGDDLEAEHQLAGVAVADGGVAAGVGGEDAADGGTALAAEGEGEEAALGGGGLLGGGDDDAGFRGHGHVEGVHVAHAVEAGEADDDLGAGLVGGGTADHGGVAALGDHRDAGGGEEANGGGEGLRRRGADEEGGAAGVEAAPVGEVGGEVGGVRDQAAGAEGGGEGVEQGRGEGGGAGGEVVGHGGKVGRGGRGVNGVASVLRKRGTAVCGQIGCGGLRAGRRGAEDAVWRGLDKSRGGGGGGWGGVTARSDAGGDGHREASVANLRT